MQNFLVATIGVAVIALFFAVQAIWRRDEKYAMLQRAYKEMVSERNVSRHQVRSLQIRLNRQSLLLTHFEQLKQARTGQLRLPVTPVPEGEEEEEAEDLFYGFVSPPPPPLEYTPLLRPTQEVRIWQWATAPYLPAVDTIAVN